MHIRLELLVLLLHVCSMHWSAVDCIGQQVQHCPSWCSCDVFGGLNMANCSGENLISANIGMPPSVELLDLSYNDITTIDNECFKELRHVKMLLLNRNSISFIELDAFSSLSELNTINLTYNRLESFDNRIFEQNFHLTSVDLSGNKFMHLPNMPILRSISLKTLNLHKSQLTHLHVNYFGELPNITSIDLSENLLIVLNLAAFAINKALRHINVYNNRIKCDEQTEMSIVWLNRNRVDVAMDNCPKKLANESTPRKFERMLMTPSNVSTPLPIGITNNRTTIDLNNIWNTHNDNDHNIPILRERCNVNEATVKHACQLFEKCVSNFTILVEDVEQKLLLNSGSNMRVAYDPMRMHHSWYEFISVQVAFYGGLLLGTVFGAIVLFTVKLISECVMSDTDTYIDSDQRRRRKIRNRQFISSEMRDVSDTVESGNNSATQNVRSLFDRRQTTRDIVPMNNHQSRQSASFFAIFYERPVRHRYYRQINRSATNLVRRLSQSRLFLNSSRAQNAAQREIYRRRMQQEASNTIGQRELDAMIETPNVVDTNEVTQHDVNTGHDVQNTRGSVHSLNISRDFNENRCENRYSAIRTFASENDVFRNGERCETPPPPYNVVAQNAPF